MSPDVQVLGERSFNGSCSSMVNTADNLYNTKLSLGTSSSGKENLPPKRITHPSKWLSSPYDHNERGPLQQHEIELHRGIVALSKVEPHRRFFFYTLIFHFFPVIKWFLIFFLPSLTILVLNHLQQSGCVD